jgi:hypothetical protein
MIIIFINDNNSVIKNNYGRLQDLMFLFEIPMGKGKDYVEIYRLLGHASSKSLTISVIERSENETIRKTYSVSCIRYVAS